MIHRIAKGSAKQRLLPAFTLVELLVVIAIIGLLMSIALPAFSSAKDRAKSVATQGTINAIESGLQLYRTETSLGGTLPPSRSDFGVGDDYPGDILSPINVNIEYPEAEPSTGYVQMTGASLLLYALGGPDDKGTAGFRDLDGDEFWANNTSCVEDSGGLYDPKNNVPRYGPYIDASLMEEIAETGIFHAVTHAPITGLVKEHKIETAGGKFNWYGGGYRTEMSYAEAAQRFFVDKFRRPILYYKARNHAQVMVHNPNAPGELGTFDHRDNALLTGGYAPGTIGNRLSGTGFVKEAAYLGSSQGSTRMHDISETYYYGNANFGKTPPFPRFDNFIRRKSSRGTPQAVNSDTYLLISAGADGIYGSNDDVINWSR